MVGTPWPTVARSRCMRRRVSPAFHGDGVIRVQITFTSSSQTRVMEPTCANGSGEMRRSPGALITPAQSAVARRHSWSNTAPLGTPVVPLVHTMATVSVGSACTRRASGSPGGASRTTWRSITCHGPAGIGAVSARPASVITTLGSARVMMLSTSARPRRGFTPLVIAPSRMTAWYATA